MIKELVIFYQTYPNFFDCRKIGKVKFNTSQLPFNVYCHCILSFASNYGEVLRIYRYNDIT